jgi:hypothetical protein
LIGEQELQQIKRTTDRPTGIATTDRPTGIATTDRSTGIATTIVQQE